MVKNTGHQISPGSTAPMPEPTRERMSDQARLGRRRPITLTTASAKDDTHATNDRGGVASDGIASRNAPPHPEG
jgi:hypothetical protein